MFIGVDSKAKKVSKCFIGVNGVAKKVVSIYCGISNLARKIFSSGNHIKSIVSMDAYRIASPSLGSLNISSDEHCLMIGGDGASGASYSVEAYDKNLTHYTLTNSNYNATQGRMGGAVGNYYVSHGGKLNDTGYYTFECYENSALTKSIVNLNYDQRACGGYAELGNYLIFAGGQTGAISNRLDSVIAVDGSLTRTNMTSIDTAATAIAGEQADNYALFTGGYASSGELSNMYAYDKDLTKQTTFTGRKYSTNTIPYHTKNSKYAFFKTNTLVTATDAFDSNLTRTIVNIGVAKSDLFTAPSEKYAFFAGGKTSTASNTGFSKTVEAFDEDLTLTNFEDLSVTRNFAFGGRAGNTVIFAGGQSGSSQTQLNSAEGYIVS